MNGAGDTKTPVAAVFWQGNYIAEAPRFLAVAEGFPAPIRPTGRAPLHMMMHQRSDLYTGPRRCEAER